MAKWSGWPEYIPDPTKFAFIKKLLTDEPLTQSERLDIHCTIYDLALNNRELDLMVWQKTEYIRELEERLHQRKNLEARLARERTQQASKSAKK